MCQKVKTFANAIYYKYLLNRTHGKAFRTLSTSYENLYLQSGAQEQCERV